MSNVVTADSRNRQPKNDQNERQFVLQLLRRTIAISNCLPLFFSFLDDEKLNGELSQSADDVNVKVKSGLMPIHLAVLNGSSLHLFR